MSRRLTSLVAALFGFAGLLAGGTSFFASQAAAKALTAEQRAEIRQIVQDVLLENPEIILEAISLLNQKQEETSAAEGKKLIAQYKDDLFFNPADPVLGNPKGDIVLVEFTDYQCGYCKKMFGPLTKALEGNPRIRLVVKELPILSPDSVLGAKYAFAAHKQGKYGAFHSALMTARGPLNEKTVKEQAARVGLNLAQAEKDAESEEVARTLGASMELARKLGLRGTPAFFVGDGFVAGADLDSLLAAIDEAGKNK